MIQKLPFEHKTKGKLIKDMYDKINEIIDAVNVNNELHEICENINKNNDGFENFLQNGFIKKSDLEKYLKRIK